MKIALVCSHGGHLTEMLQLMEAFEGHDVFFVTYTSPRTSNLGFRSYLIENIGKSPIRMLKSFFQIHSIFVKEKPDMVLSTGSEIAIPAFFLAGVMGIKTIFIESWCRISTKSFTGRVLYYVSDIFLVQWPQLLKIYGKKARFEGAVI
jgi:beta-1,4-N-acetylglucosaminyltransferase